MPKGLTELIEYVLEQIALCGEHGASINDYKHFVEQFYAATNPASATSLANQSFQSPPKGYKRIQQLAWEWLTKNPEIWVGQNKEGNSLSLDQIEAREAELSTTLVQSSLTAQDKELEPQQRATNNKQKPVGNVDAPKPFRVWTTRDRVWKTLAGHGVDFKRIPPMEFKALGFIAAAGEKGILQPELIHLTGQDKRSLPKRTDNLAKNGYVDKSAVWLKSQKTSLLRLTRFAPKGTTEVFSNGRLMLDNFLRNLCEWVKESDSIPLSDLEEKLDCTTPGWEKTMLWRSLERLDIIGVIERFHRPTPVPAKRDWKINTVRVLKQRCIRLVKVPDEDDKHRYYTISKKDRDLFRQRLELQDAEAKKEHAEHGEDDEDYASAVTPDTAPASLPLPDPVTPKEHRQPALRWNPDFPYTNNMLNVLDKADSSGMSTMELREHSYGHFYQRAVDQILGRLTDDWEKSQPSNLRHLSIIRDTGSSGKYSHYSYRTHPQFQEAVDNGQTSWEIVSQHTANPPADQMLDDWGFPVIKPSQLIQNGRATLGECLASARVAPESLTASDPVLVKHTDGTIGAKWVKTGPDAVKRKAPAVRRKDTGSSVVADFIPQLQDAPITKDQSAYNAAYRKMQRLKQQAKERTLQIRRQAEQLAYEEALTQNDTNSNQSQSQAVGSGKTIKHVFIPPRSKPALVIVNDIDIDGDAAGKVDAPKAPTPVATLATTPAEPVKKPRKVRPSSFIRESRIQEFVLQLSDLSRSAVHINPPGSLFDEKIGPGRPFKKQHMVVFKFPWLKNFDWFLAEPVRPPQATDHLPYIATHSTELLKVMPNAIEHRSQIPASEHESEIDIEPEVVLDDRPQSTVPALSKAAEAAATKKVPEKKSLPAPGVYVKKTRGRRPIDGPRKLVLIFRSDHLHELLLDEDSTNEVANSVPAIFAKHPIELMYGPTSTQPRRISPHSEDFERNDDSDVSPLMQDEGQPQNTTPFTSRRSYNAQSPDTSQGPVGNIPRSDSGPSSKPGLVRRKKGMSLGSGAVRLKRENLVIHMLDKCGGMFPGDSEIVGPYQRIQKQIQGVQSDRATVMRAVTNLVNNRKLNRIGFEFSGNDGKSITKHLLLKPEIQIDAPEVQDMIAEIRKAHPMNFIPEALEDPSYAGAQRPVISRYIRAEERPSDVANALDVSFALDIKAKRKQLEGKRLSDVKQVRGAQKQKQQEKIEQNRERQKELQNRQKDDPNLRPWQRNGSSVPSSESGRSRRGRTSSIAFEGDGPVSFSYGNDIDSRRSSDPKTLGELLAKMGSFAPDSNDADPTYDPMEEDEMLPSIEQDFGPVTRGRLRSRVQYRVPVDEDFWVMEDPMEINARALPTERSSSMYSFDGTEAQQERRLRSESEDNACWSVEKTLEVTPRKRRRLNEQKDHENFEPNIGLPQFAGYRRSFKDLAPRRTDTRKNITSHSTLVHDVLTFKPPIGPEKFDPNYQWQQIRCLLNPDQRFHARSGTFSTDFFAIRNVRDSEWVDPPGPLMFEHMSSTNEADIQTLIDVDDFDNHYHPDKLQNKRTIKQARFFYADSDDDSGDEIERAWFERQELELMLQQYPGLSFAKKSDGFVNYSLSHDLEVSKEPIDPKARKYKKRVTMYGAKEQDIADIQSGQQPRARMPISRGPATGSASQGGPTSLKLPLLPARSVAYTGNKVTAKQSGKCFISAEVAKRLLFVAIAIRALAGGIDQTIRWPFIVDVFHSHPEFDAPTFKARWLRMFNNHRVLVEQLEQEFREKFLVAYARGEVQATDVRDLKSYNWSAIADWAIENIPVYPDDITLPSTREMVDNSYDIMVTSRDTQESRERMDHSMATNMARAQYAGELLFALPLRAKQAKKAPTTATISHKEYLEIARSWTRACSATRDLYFNSQLAEAKLKTIPDAVLKEAIEQLHAEKLISHQFKGRMKPGRAFRLADTYHSSLFSKRQLEPQHFLEAVAFKKYLDSSFSIGEDTILLQGGFKDGDIMVLTELASTGRLELRPKLPPVNSNIGDPWPRLSVWGFSEGHYRLRNLDKRTFYWDVEIFKTENYVYGLPTQQKFSSIRPPPGPTMANSGKELIPIWYDIHGNLDQYFWAHIVRCVAQAAAFHAGCSIENLTTAFKGFIWEWEVVLCAKWLIEMGVAKWIGGDGRNDGLMMLEWWWSIVPEVPEEEKTGKGSAVSTVHTQSSRSTGLRSVVKSK